MASDHQYGDEGYPPVVEDAIDAVNEIGSVSNVTETVGRVTVDFAAGETDATGLSLLERAKGGRFGSGMVVDTDNQEIINATLRLGSMGLKEGSDLYLAAAEVEKVASEADPPTGVSAIEDEEPIFVRFRDMSGAQQRGNLIHEGNDIVHVVLRERAPAEPFLEWMTRFVRLYERQKPTIRQRVRDVGVNR